MFHTVLWCISSLVREAVTAFLGHQAKQSPTRPAEIAGVGDGSLGGDLAEPARATAIDESAAWKLFRERADKSYSFTDCVSFVMMSRLGLEQAAAFVPLQNTLALAALFCRVNPRSP